MRTPFVLATIVATGLILQGCVTTDPDGAYSARQSGAAVGNLLGNAAKGATVGALVGAGASPKGSGRRSNGAVRGALIGAGAGTLASFLGGPRTHRPSPYGHSGNYYRPECGDAPTHGAYMACARGAEQAERERQRNLERQWYEKGRQRMR